MFLENEPEDIDLLQLLKSREPSADKKQLFDVPYSDVLLIFDLDPQAPDYSGEGIRRMAEYFVESLDMGKLYLNYPMVEAFYHMKEIPDPEYDARIVVRAQHKQPFGGADENLDQIGFRRILYVHL